MNDYQIFKELYLTCLGNMGGSSLECLLADQYTWIVPSDLSCPIEEAKEIFKNSIHIQYYGVESGKKLWVLNIDEDLARKVDQEMIEERKDSPEVSDHGEAILAITAHSTALEAFKKAKAQLEQAEANMKEAVARLTK